MSSLPTQKRSALVWIISGLFLLFYGLLGLLNFTIPGLEELSSFIEDMTGMHLYTAAFLAIFFEGDHSYAKDIPTAMFWVFKAILGGVTYPQPITTGGLIVLILARFASMILLGLMMSLVGTIMRKLLIGSEKDS